MLGLFLSLLPFLPLALQAAWYPTVYGEKIILLQILFSKFAQQAVIIRWLQNYRLYRIRTAPLSERCSISNLLRIAATRLNILENRQHPRELPTSLDIVKGLGASQGFYGS